VTDFKPSDVVLGIPPLCGTMGKSEIEVAAAIVVRALAIHGDAWRELTEAEMQRAIDGDPYIDSLARDPFLNADFCGLRHHGYGTEPNCYGLTEKGIEAIRKWVRPPVAIVAEGTLPGPAPGAGQDDCG
jgi:hypothetical protein